MSIITSIDLGSNSFRVLSYNCETNSSVAEFEKTVGTADGLSLSGKISKEALKRVVDAIKESIDSLKYDPNSAIAVTTQAMRVASNSIEILKDIQTHTGVNFKIIDGEKEAELTLLAMQYALKRENIDSDKFILLDIGGGSTELIIYNKSDINIKSFGFGIVTLTQSKDKQKDLDSFEKDILKFIEGYDFTEFNFVATAGTPTTIAALKHGLEYDTYDKQIVNGTVLCKEDIETLQKELNLLSKEQLIKKVGSGRDDYIDTGVEIFKIFYKTLQKENAIVFDDGLREGVAIDHCINSTSL